MKESCATCKKEFGEVDLVYSRMGKICRNCEGEAALNKDVYRGVWLTIFGGPVLAMGGLGTSCVFSTILGPLAAIVFVGFGLGCFGHAARAGQLFLSLEHDYPELKVGATEKVGLILAAIASGLGGMFLLGFGLLNGLLLLETIL